MDIFGNLKKLVTKSEKNFELTIIIKDIVPRVTLPVSTQIACAFAFYRVNSEDTLKIITKILQIYTMATSSRSINLIS